MPFRRLILCLGLSIIAKSLSDKIKSIEEGLPARCANETFAHG
jgi:hypothetical protein